MEPIGVRPRPPCFNVELPSRWGPPTHIRERGELQSSVPATADDEQRLVHDSIHPNSQARGVSGCVVALNEPRATTD